jgi:hypothetical protein
MFLGAYIPRFLQALETRLLFCSISTKAKATCSDYVETRRFS